MWTISAGCVIRLSLPSRGELQNHASFPLHGRDELAQVRAMSQAASPPPLTQQLSAALIISVVAAGCRAGWIALQDRYFAGGATAVGIRSAATDLLFGIVVCTPAVFLVLAGMVSGRRSRFALPAAAFLVVGLALFMTSWLPYSSTHAIGMGGVRQVVAQGGTWLLATVLSGHAMWAQWPSTRLFKFARIASLLVFALTALLQAPFWNAKRTWPEQPNVILISLDTLRADHLGCYGYELNTSPNLDRFADHAVQFERAYCPQPWTLTSHMSLLTGLWPSVHGVDRNTQLPESVTTLANRFQDQGYTTAAVVDSVPWLAPKFGFDRGFHWYRQVHGTAAKKHEVTSHLLADLQQGPFFLFLHYFDAHSDFDKLPYEAAAADYEEFAGHYTGDFHGCDDRLGCASDYLRNLNEQGVVPDAEIREYLVNLYDAGVRTLDREFGQLLAMLESHQLLDNALIVVTADHGEEFFEHGKTLHDQYYEESLRVPLLIRTPQQSSSKKVTDLVSLIDLAPAIEAICGWDPAVAMRSSLASAIQAGQQGTPREHVLIDHGRGNLSIRTQRYKLLWNRGEYEFYDLEQDPGETNDLWGDPSIAAAQASLVARLAQERQRLLDERELIGPSLPNTTLTPEERRQIRALGYTDE